MYIIVDFMLLFLEFNLLKLRLVTRNNIFMAKGNSIVPAPFVCPSWDVIVFNIFLPF
jgi:hypothetical protein